MTDDQGTPALLLLQRISAGDKSAFADFYQLFQSRVFSTAFSYLQQTEDAEEITQDVFVEVFRSASRFDGRSSVSTWIYRITVNKSLDRLRYRKARKRFGFLSAVFWDDEPGLEESIPDQSHHGQDADKREDIQLLLKALEKIPEKQKTALILTQIEELSGKETAAIMNMSAKAVESLIQRGKASLKKQLEKIYDTRRK